MLQPALILAQSAEQGDMCHIKINKSGVWAYAKGPQHIAGSMTMTTLLKIHDGDAETPVTKEILEAAAENVTVPAGNEIGECLPWVLKVVGKLHEGGYLSLTSIDHLGQEFDDFAGRNKDYANRNTYPNTISSNVFK